MKDWIELIVVNSAGIVVWADAIPTIDAVIKWAVGISIVVFNIVRIYQMLNKKTKE